MTILYILAAISLAGGLLLVFGRDWVWKIDGRNEAHERDADGNSIRTEQWDRMHLMQGIIMIVVAIVIAIIATVI